MEDKYYPKVKLLHVREKLFAIDNVIGPLFVMSSI